jgi:hypothetical protein
MPLNVHFYEACCTLLQDEDVNVVKHKIVCGVSNNQNCGWLFVVCNVGRIR